MITHFADWLTYSILKLEENSHLAESVSFFVNDTIKIVLLLILVTHFMGWLRYHLPTSKIRNFLAEKKLFGLEYFFATIFGAVTPFCSCSSIPLFVGFIRAGIPLGVTLSFLITSPLINEVALVLFWTLFGWEVTLLYLVSGLSIGMAGGWILQKMNLEDQVEEFLTKPQCSCSKKKEEAALEKKEPGMWHNISREAFSITRKILPYLLIGIGIGAIIHGFVPEGYFEQFLTQNVWWTVPLAVLLAVPLYANASAVIPIIDSLVLKGVPLGTALAFMMAVVGLSFPEALILKRVMKMKLLLSFFGVVTLGIIVLGFLFNVLF
ncbi:permease [Candidatus Gracilibacteria bacterium]|nr:permease [Candidatus Gracilibacteria bacterium]MCF7819305.1 permease [Candidatus Gracilibacteria bacterium]